jgi:hypothetical protein
MAREIVYTDAAPKPLADTVRPSRQPGSFSWRGSRLSILPILDDEGDFAGMNEEWAKWFPKDPPTRQGAKLPIRPKGMKVSIAVIAEA